tara:strand:- start:61 stop:810 length:750 start_codon:yes stop_codon:yes gene_type:complete
MIIRFFPDQEKTRNIEKPAVLNLDEKVLEHPPVAISNAQAEIRGVVGLTERVLGSLVSPFVSDELQADIEDPDQDFDKGMQVRLDKIEFLNQAILSYLVKISKQDLDDAQSREVFSLVSVVNYLNLIKNAVSLRFSILLGKKDSLDSGFTEIGQNELIEYHNKMLKQIKRLGQFFEKYDRKKIEKIMKKGEKYKNLEEKYRIEHIKRISVEESESKPRNQLQLELMDLLKEISIFIDLIASNLLELETI